MAGEIEGAERALSSLQEVPWGILRLTTGPNVAFLGPILNDYIRRYPEVLLSNGHDCFDVPRLRFVGSECVQLPTPIGPHPTIRARHEKRVDHTAHRTWTASYLLDSFDRSRASPPA
jgi:hypothetical protein